MQVMDQEDGCRHQLLPPGFRFHPMDDEIITHYLWEKVVDNNFKARAIGEVDLNKCEPWDLPSKAKNIGEKEWYFFCHKDRKYPTGMRTNRATEAGYWKATGKDKEIYNGKDNILVGMKKTLVFYMGRAPKGEKTNWIMHEYRLEDKSCYHLPRNAKDEWSVCRVFNKKSETKRSSDGSNDQMMMRIDMTKSSSINPYLADDQFLESHSTLPHLINNTSTTSNNLNDYNPFAFIPSTSTFDPQITPETLIFPSSYLGKGKDMDYCLNQEMGSFKNEEHYYPHQSMQVTSSSQDTRISIDKDQEMSSPEEDVGCCQYYEEIENLWK